MKKIIVPTEKDVITNLIIEIENCSNQAITENGSFRVGLSGGSMLNYLCAAIPQIKTDLTKWKFFLCDERYVDDNDAESNFGGYKKHLIPIINITEKQFVTINSNLTLNECAQEYERQIRREFPAEDIPSFDLLLLGMGPDGHTCSLFPEHPLLRETTKLIAPIDNSPKSPPKRVTMTYPLINNAKHCLFAICGEAKAEIVKRIFVNKEELPAGLVAPHNGELICIFDEGAAKFM